MTYRAAEYQLVSCTTPTIEGKAAVFQIFTDGSGRWEQQIWRLIPGTMQGEVWWHGEYYTTSTSTDLATAIGTYSRLDGLSTIPSWRIDLNCIDTSSASSVSSHSTPSSDCFVAEAAGNIFGSPVSFGNVPAGTYTILYLEGALKFYSSYGWSVNGSETNYWLVEDASSAEIVRAPGFYDQHAFTTQSAAEAASAGQYTTFDWTGGELFLRLLDEPYDDNVAGTPTPTFRITNCFEGLSSPSSSGNGCTTCTFTNAATSTPELLGTYPAGDYSLSYLTGAFSLSGSGWWVGSIELLDADGNRIAETGHLGPSTVYTTQAAAQAAWSAAGVTTTFVLGASTTLYIRASDVSWGDNQNGSPNPEYSLCFLGDNSSSSVVVDNTSCTDATVISSMPFTANAALGTIGERRWYKFTPSGDCTVTIQTCAMNNFDSYLRLYSDCGTTVIAEDDDGCGDTSSIITASVMAGHTYWISVGAYDDSDTGNFQLDVSGC